MKKPAGKFLKYLIFVVVAFVFVVLIVLVTLKKPVQEKEESLPAVIIQKPEMP